MLVGPEIRVDGRASRGEQIRLALRERLDQLRGERGEALSAMRDSGAADAGDDLADLGTKAFTLEQDYLLVTTFQNQIDQIARALDRLDGGNYGWCERCGKEIPVARLAAFPSATQCVGCKEIEERR